MGKREAKLRLSLVQSRFLNNIQAVIRTVIEFKGVSKVFPNGTQALKNVDLTIHDGEFVVVVGLSGAGKSTLLRSVNQLNTVTAGQILIDGQDITKLNEDGLRKLRTRVGMIFQQHNLVKRSSVIRNVLAGRLGQVSTWKSVLGLWSKEELELALRSLDRVGIKEKAYQRADQLSGGQMQRVAIARTLVQQPKVMLADEPVASLDPPTAHQVLRDLKRISQEDHITTLVNLHDIEQAIEYGDRIIGMQGGEVVFDGPAKGATVETFEKIYGRAIRGEH